MKLFWIWDENELDSETNIDEIEVMYANGIEEEEWQVALDIVENSWEIIIISPIAWVNLENIDISLKDDILTISWIREKPTELYSSHSISRVSETFWGRFSRNIILPDNLDLDSIKAILEKNILILRIPKLKFKGQAIEIEKTDS